MRVLFQPYGDRPTLTGQVLAEHPDGSATLRIDIPGDKPAIVVAFPGQGEGRWWPLKPEPPPLPKAARAKVMATREPPPVAVSKPPAMVALQTCKLCFRRHRGEDYMYCDTCRPGVPPTPPRRSRGK